MTTNQTIDGVPRELLEKALRDASTIRFPTDNHVTELRALLDAPAYPNRLCHTDYTTHPYICGCLKGDEEAQRRFDEHQAKAAQPQGKPVAHCLLRRNGSGEWVNDAKSWADGAPSREIMAECEKHPELYRVRLAYAEQPAPVAVVMPERLPGDDGVCTESHYASGWNACLDELKRLNPSL